MINSSPGNTPLPAPAIGTDKDEACWIPLWHPAKAAAVRSTFPTVPTKSWPDLGLTFLPFGLALAFGRRNSQPAGRSSLPFTCR